MKFCFFQFSVRKIGGNIKNSDTPIQILIPEAQNLRG